MNKKIFFNILASFSFGFFYGYFDFHIEYATGYMFMSQIFPWIILFSMFTIPNLLIDYKHLPLGLANSFTALSFEDISYWIWARKLPYQWSLIYPVILHIPLDDIAGFIIASILYKYGDTLYIKLKGNQIINNRGDKYD